MLRKQNRQRQTAWQKSLRRAKTELRTGFLHFGVIVALVLSLVAQFWVVPLAAEAAPASLAVCGDPFTHTYEVQGTGETSPLLGQTVTVEGVVVGDYEGPSPTLRGFFIQDEVGDGNPATSDGLFVFNGSNNSVSAGQVVRVTGQAQENQGQTQLGSLTSGSILNCGRTATITPTDVTLPFSSATYLERYEGMLVRLPQTLYVTESFQLGRFDQLVMSSGDRLRQPTQLADPGAPAQAIQNANDLNRVIVDDNLQNQNPDPIIFGGGTSPLSAANTVRMGDSATGITGILNYTWAGNGASPNAYRVRPTVPPNFVATNPRPTSPEDVGGTLHVAFANVLNFFNTFSGCTFGVGGASADCRGAENATEYERQAAKTISALLNLKSDVIGLSEVENDGYGPTSAIADLVNRLNAAAGPGTFAFIDADAATGQVNVLGTDAIKVALIYKPAKVTPVGNTAVLNTGAFGLFQLANGTQQGRSRPALAQTFQQNSDGARFTAVVNHLKSKSSACTDNVSPVGPDPDTGDLQGNCNLTRKQAAIEEVAWLATNPTGIADPDVLILGDMNSYAKEDPIKAFENGGYINLIAQNIGPNAYSYVFNGQSGYLDHALGSSSLSDQVSGITEYHINADEPTVLDYNTNFKSAGQVASLYAPDQYRASDHDPIVIGLNLDGVAPTINIASPAAGAIYLQDEAVAASYSCSDNPGGTGVASCVGTVPSGSNIDTSTPGSHTFTVMATDRAGNTASASVNYTVYAPRDYIKWVRDNIAALRATANKTDASKLDGIILNLDKALDLSLWRDASHPDPKKGGNVFSGLSEAVAQLRALQNDKKSIISPAVLQTFINQLYSSSRELASIAIGDATTAGGNTSKALDELAKADADFAAGKYASAVDHCGNAWNEALIALP